MTQSIKDAEKEAALVRSVADLMTARAEDKITIAKLREEESFLGGRLADLKEGKEELQGENTTLRGRVEELVEALSAEVEVSAKLRADLGESMIRPPLHHSMSDMELCKLFSELPEINREIRGHIYEGKKIQAIKTLRTVVNKNTGLGGLRAAKTVVNVIWDCLRPEEIQSRCRNSDCQHCYPGYIPFSTYYCTDKPE